MSSGLVDLEALVRDALALQPLSASVARMTACFSRSDWDLGEVCETIRLDQALTGRLLGTANSAASGSSFPVTTVDQAVVRLGPGKVMALAIASSVKAPMSAALPEYGLSEGELWRHSVTAALAVDLARPLCRVETDSEAFAAALLHDVGKLVLARHLSGAAAECVRRACDEHGLSSEEAEEKVLCVPHAEVGALVAEGWKLPKAIAAGIRFHHGPLYAPDEASRRLCFQIALADAVAGTVNANGGEPPKRAAFTPDLADRLGLTRQKFDRLCEEVGERLDETLALYT